MYEEFQKENFEINKKTNTNTNKIKHGNTKMNGNDKKNEWIKKLQFVTIEIANRKCFFLVKMWTTNA